MDIYSGHINKLIEQLSRLPGVGAKSAQRLAFHIINMPQKEVDGLTNAITSAKANVRYCKECFTLTEKKFVRYVPIRHVTIQQLWWLNIRVIWQHMKDRQI